MVATAQPRSIQLSAPTPPRPTNRQAALRRARFAPPEGWDRLGVCVHCWRFFVDDSLSKFDRRWFTAACYDQVRRARPARSSS